MNVHVDYLGELYRVKIDSTAAQEDMTKIYVYCGGNKWKLISPSRTWRYGEILRRVVVDKPILDFENWIFLPKSPKK